MFLNLLRTFHKCDVSFPPSCAAKWNSQPAAKQTLIAHPLCHQNTTKKESLSEFRHLTEQTIVEQTMRTRGLKRLSVAEKLVSYKLI